MRNISDISEMKLITHILCCIMFCRKSCRLWEMWKQTVEQNRPQMTIWRMSSACWILKIILNSVRQHNNFITQGNYKATCFNYRLVILRPILSIVSQDAMHTLGSYRVYIYGIHQIKSVVSKGVMCKLCLQAWDT